MSTLHKMAEKFASEMIEHNLSCGASALNLQFIADQACELAYMIDKQIGTYVKDADKDFVTKKDLDKAVREYRSHHHTYTIPAPVPHDE